MCKPLFGRVKRGVKGNQSRNLKEKIKFWLFDRKENRKEKEIKKSTCPITFNFITLERKIDRKLLTK